MILKGIISARRSSLYRSFAIVQNWEDIISQKTNYKIISNINLLNFVLWNLNKVHILKHCFLFFNKIYPVKNKYYLYFHMTVDPSQLQIDCLKPVIPVLIDYWLSDSQLRSFYQYYASSKCLLVSSKEVYQYLLSNNCPIAIRHFPLSLPDNEVSIKYLSQPKEYDFIFAGRVDPVFWDYVALYREKHPKTKIYYVYQQITADNTVNYVTNEGKTLDGDFSQREEYLKLIRKSRIAFYVTPGMDPSKKANGFNQVTPRFLEFIASGCLVMGRYPVNPDTEFYELKEYCPLINSYQDFENTLALFYNQYWAENHISKYFNYLQKHTTSARVGLLNKILNEL